jgi:hypothetical protein
MTDIYQAPQWTITIPEGAQIYRLYPNRRNQTSPALTPVIREMRVAANRAVHFNGRHGFLFCLQIHGFSRPFFIYEEDAREVK